MSTDLSPALLTATAIVALASAVQTASGMGMALIAAPLLALLDSQLVPVPTLFAVMSLSALVSWWKREDVDQKVLPVALAGLFIGCFGGMTLLTVIGTARVDRVFALLILGAIAMSLSGTRIPSDRLSLLIGGIASGILGTVTGAHGPPIALTLQHKPPVQLRATLCAFFAAGCALSLLVLAAGGFVDRAGVEAALMLFPGVIAGFLAGLCLSRWIDARRARWTVLVMSALSACLLLLR
jgi:uncharacterized protein